MLLICARAGDLAAGSYATLWTAAARWAGAGWPEPGGRSRVAGAGWPERDRPQATSGFQSAE